jgi:ABC-type uncharacterized transport system involved in gliding motility auxiliary subunit
MWKDEFEPVLLSTLAAAFDLAWDFIEKSPQTFSNDKQVSREELAAIIIRLAQRGEDNKLRIANRAITILRGTAEQTRPELRVNSLN